MAEKILTIEQLRILDLFSREPYLVREFYLTGGTPLAAFYLHHRRSEDLDFFSEREVNIIYLRNFIGKWQKKLKLQAVDYKNFLGLHTFQFYFSPKNILKVDFNYYPFPRIEKGIKYKNISIDSWYDIAVNKVHTIAMKPRARDFIDIYFLIKEKKLSFKKLLLDAKAKFDWHIDPLQLGAQLIKAKELKDFPVMLKRIGAKEWREFFIAEAKKLKKDIFE